LDGEEALPVGHWVLWPAEALLKTKARPAWNKKKFGVEVIKGKKHRKNQGIRP